uniref:Secreted protein n=1 Tax=Hucho hucho TaxID=62062 RepID=A0A4W5MN79_9TELE
MMRIPLFPPWLTFLLSCSLVVFPLYRSSSETLKKTMSIIGDSSKVRNHSPLVQSDNESEYYKYLIITQEICDTTNL